MSDDRDELLMLYQQSGNDTWQTKRQQWSVTYYALLVHAALFGVYKARLTWEPEGLFMIVGLATLMAFYGFWDLVRSQLSLVKFRRRAKAVRMKLSNEFRNCYGDEEPDRVSPLKDFSFMLGMMLAMSAGALAVCWLVYGQTFQLLLVSIVLVVSGALLLAHLVRKADKLGPNPDDLTQPDQ